MLDLRGDDPMSHISYARQLWSQSREIAGACRQHPFVTGLADGSLPAEVFVGYIGQDAFFLEAFAQAYAAGVARSPDRETMHAFYELLGGAFEELRLHEGVAAKHDVDLTRVTPIPATRAYTDFLLATAFQGSLGDLLAAMVPCMRLYQFLGSELSATTTSESYRDWIDTYSSDEFAALTSTIEDLLDRTATRSVQEAAKYRRAMELELAFFEASYPDRKQ